MEGRDLITRLPGSTDYRQGTVKNFAPRKSNGTRGKKRRKDLEKG